MVRPRIAGESQPQLAPSIKTVVSAARASKLTTCPAKSIFRPRRGFSSRMYLTVNSRAAKPIGKLTKKMLRHPKVWTKSPPLIGAKLGHQFLRVANPREYSDGDRFAPSPTFSVRYVPTSSPGWRFRRNETHRRISYRPAQPA